MHATGAWTHTQAKHSCTLKNKPYWKKEWKKWTKHGVLSGTIKDDTTDIGISKIQQTEEKNQLAVPTAYLLAAVIYGGD